MGITGRSILISNEIIGKTGEIENQYVNDYSQQRLKHLDKTSIFASILSHQLVTGLDTINLISTALCGLALLTSFSTEVTDKEANTQVFYLGLLYLSVNSIFSIICSFFAQSKPDRRLDFTKIKKYTADKIKVQIYVSTACSILTSIVIPIIMCPRKFTIGRSDWTMFNMIQVNRGDVVFGLLGGVIINCFLMYYAQKHTSNNFKDTQEIAIYSKYGFGMQQVLAQAHSNSSMIWYFMFFALVCITGYLLAGFYGIAIISLGLICTPVSLLSINFFTGVSQDAYQFAYVGRILGQLKDDLASIRYAARNYSIFIQITIAGSQFLANLILLGLIVVLTKDQAVYIWDAYCIFGILMGSSMAYFITGTTQNTQKQICEKIVSKDTIGLGDDQNGDKMNDPRAFIKQKYVQSVMCVLLNLIILLSLIMFIGFLFGGDAIAGFSIGFNLVGLHMIIDHMITGHSLRNSKFYNDEISDQNYTVVNQGQDQNMIKSRNHVIVQSYVLSYGGYNISGTALINFLSLATIMIAICAKVFGQSGFLRDWINSQLGYSEENVTQWAGNQQPQAGQQAVTDATTQQQVQQQQPQAQQPAPGAFYFMF